MKGKVRSYRGNRIVGLCPTGKRSYPTRAKARQASHSAQRVRGLPLDVYKCDMILRAGELPEPGCGQYHLATRRAATVVLRKDRTDAE